MYTKNEVSRLKEEFWSAFGQYMLPIQSAEGLKVNWINYKTGFSQIIFRMSADNCEARISIDLVHKDEDIRQLYFQQFLQLKDVFEDIMQEGWIWESHANDASGKEISRISKKLEDVSIFRKDDWPKIISFLKPRIILLDEFWTSVSHIFNSLR